ncbi:hypothetical protein TNCV_1475071 [Trichonephila clavipes]|nr:hypothetical protein TNCV_1475071 [Trichonephila clavipes]
MLAHRLTRDIPPAATPDQLWQNVEATWTAVPQGYIQNLFDSMQRRVAVDIANNVGYIRSNSWDAQLAVPNDHRYARLETNLGIGCPKEGP